MAEATGDRATALCNAAKDVSRHIAALVDELNHLQHPHDRNQAPGEKMINRQICKIRDQLNLLGTVIDDIDRLEHGGVLSSS